MQDSFEELFTYMELKTTIKENPATRPARPARNKAFFFPVFDIIRIVYCKSVQPSENKHCLDRIVVGNEREVRIFLLHGLEFRAGREPGIIDIIYNGATLAPAVI